MKNNDINTVSREKLIVRTSFIGICANIFLSAFKASIGFLSGSIAIVLDSVNNLSDALSSVITIIGTKLAGKPADKKHPFGHGRVEYITAMVIAIIILYAGITSFIESVKKILNPTIPEYSGLSIIILLVAIFIKIALGLFVKAMGKKANSDSLIASGKDALMDSIISASTVAAAFIFIIWKLPVEAYLGVIISAIILFFEHRIVRRDFSKIDRAFFTLNGYLGILFFCFIFIDLWN